MSNSGNSNSDRRLEAEETPEELWKHLKIDFRLESKKFPDNKIYGVIAAEPESSRKLIKRFELVVQGKDRVVFDKETTLEFNGKSHNESGDTDVSANRKIGIVIDDKTSVGIDGKIYTELGRGARVEINGKARITSGEKTRVTIDAGTTVDFCRETRVSFDKSFKTIAASGLNTEKTDRSVYVEAFPIEPGARNKKSTARPFSFTGKVIALNPTLTFQRSDDSPPILVVSWFHIGDRAADQYIMYLDDVDIQYIRQKQIRDEFEVKINGFKPGVKHTFQLVAQRKRRETQRSDLLDFIVPDNSSIDTTATNEYITVLEQSVPSNLPIFFSETEKSSDPDSDASESTPEIQKKPKTSPEKKPEHEDGTCICCKHLPHDEFPGFDHYFKDSIDPSSRSAKKTPTKGNRRHSSEDETDDDDDAVALGDRKKKRLAFSLKVYK